MIINSKEKAMFKIFSRVAEVLADRAETPVWVRDPLSHPDIAAMDARSLGDLPFGLFRPQADAEPAAPRRQRDFAGCYRALVPATVKVAAR
jgi:hypothetical protein